jgi:membrane protein
MRECIVLRKKHFEELKSAWVHYYKRSRRIFDEPQPGHEESWLYRNFRKLCTILGKGVVFAIIVVGIFAYPVLSWNISRVESFYTFSHFEAIYIIFEYVFQVIVLPSFIYAIIILFSAHCIALVFKRVFDYGGYSIGWLSKMYVKILGDVTVVAIIFGLVTFALSVSDVKHKASFSLVDYMSFITLLVSVIFSFGFLVRAFAAMRKFFKYSAMGILFPVGCVASSWIFFDVILGGNMLDYIAKAVTGSYIDPLLARVQKLVDATPSDMSVIRKNFSDNLLLWLGTSSPEYSVVLGQMKIALLCFAVVIFVFFWVRDRKRNPTDES